MENRHPAARRSLKRKLEQQNDSMEDQTDRKVLHQDFSAKILQQVSLLNSTSSHSNRAAVKSAVHVLSELANDEDLVDTIVNGGAVPALVKHLDAPCSVKDDSDGVVEPYQHEVEKECALVLGLIAVKPEYQEFIVDAGALPSLVNLLKRHKTSAISQSLIGLLWRVADAITNLAHENTSVKTLVRMEGGIPPLVELLEFNDIKVQRAAAAALRTLAFKNDDNKIQIVECDALPTLVLMLRSDDPSIHYEAVGVIGNLVHSSPNIKKDVLLAGALQPVIWLLRSPCLESQREAALLLGQFAATDSDCKVHIAQRGSIQPLVDMLKSSDVQLREMSVFALGRLAQDSHNQAGIAHNGGIEPLLNLLDSKDGSLQHNAAFALYGLADNEDNVADIIKAGGFQKLQDGHFKVQPTKECVAKTLKRLEEKIHGRVLKHLIYLMRFAEKGVKTRVAIALAHLCSPHDRKTIFIDNNGLELLLQLLESSNVKQKGDASAALHILATKSRSVSVDAAPTSPTPQMYLGEEYINNPNLSDVTFLVEGRSFYAHRDCLLSSDIFRAMFDGGYRETEAKHIEIPNITWEVFELMMRYIYCGTVDVNLDIAQDLLKAADQYLLDDLKRICEYAISQDISVENVSLMYEMSEAFNATTLKHSCILFMLGQFDNLVAKPWYCRLVRCILPDIREFFSTLLVNADSDSDSADS
ncbi:ARM REPEAT PROTEIN INTERACTING WITH ABF2-like [Abrus precatorius]|uniref:ARM REPEAT PROTEIN INTERACTING WITH ABF2-like n=1 Tax=Abrus precatorius TaxID=3816 RepID=A0A8B8L4D9_ABRPR|nr:ARM REPEAT PROTEIN INTERACTING WITH ABF2-like [Abrus precatorius]